MATSQNTQSATSTGGNQKKKNGRKGFKINESDREEGIKLVVARMEELGLDLKSPKIVITGGDKHTGSIGTDSASAVSIDRYETFWKHLLDWCIFVGDYESAGILCRKNVLSKGRDFSPANPLPIKLDTVIHFVQFRALEKGSPLLHHQTNLPVTNKNGTELKCMGDWQSPEQIRLYASALSKLHSKYETTTGEYVSACDACQSLYFGDPNTGVAQSGALTAVARSVLVDNGVTRSVDPNLVDPNERAPQRDRNGCDRHAGNPMIWRKGCPTKATLLKTKIKQMRDYCERQYTTRHTMYFLPSEL